MAPRLKQLTVVLEQRERIEHERQRDVAALQQQANEIEARIRGAHASVLSIRHELRDVLIPVANHAVPMSDLKLQATATLHAQLRVQSLAIELAGVRARLERSQSALRAAAADRKAIQLLIDRRLETEKRATERRETADLDEIATTRFGARMNLEAQA